MTVTSARLLFRDWEHHHRPPRRTLIPAWRSPLVCCCPQPRPVQVRLFDCLVIADAFECDRCGRKVVG